MKWQWICAVVFGGVLWATPPREIAGRVEDAQTGEPIARARVAMHVMQANSRSGDVILLSEPDGSFHITNVPEGNFVFTFEKAGYLPGNQSYTVPAGSAQPAPLILRLAAQVAIEGTVVDDQGAPVPFANIQVARQSVMSGRRVTQWAGNESTDETGYFRVFGLRSGRYYVSVMAHVSGTRRAKTLAYPLLYYPNSVDLAGAQPLDLRPGQEQRLQIRLPEPLPAREIRGQVVTSGQPVLQLRRVTAPDLPPPYNSTMDQKTGAFQFTGITAGVYLLDAYAREGPRQVRASTTITVGDTDVAGIRLELSSIALKGTVRTEGSDAGARPVVFVSIQSPHYSAGSRVDDSGNFEIDMLLPDTYRVMLPSNGPFCPRSIRQGGRDALRDGLVVTAGGAPEPFDIVLTRHCGSIDGTVAMPDPNQPVNVTVGLLHRVGNELAMENQAGLRGNRFTMQGIAPGDYVLYAWPADAPIEYTNPEYMRPFESSGRPVTVTEDGTLSVTIDRVLPKGEIR